MKKNESKKTTQEVKKGGTPNQGTLQSYIQNFTKEAIDKLIYIMRHSKNENLKFGALKLVIDKSVADIKALELTGANGQPLQFSFRIDLAGGYIPPLGATFTSSSTGITRSAQIQSVGMAQTGKENNNSPN